MLGATPALAARSLKSPSAQSSRCPLGSLLLGFLLPLKGCFPRGARFLSVQAAPGARPRPGPARFRG